MGVQAVGALSKLFSESDKPFIHSRFVEQLYVNNSSATDIGRSDVSFDARTPENIGIGVKTFIAEENAKAKLEKVAEFNKDATIGKFRNLKGKQLVYQVAELRNKRITAHANELGLNLDRSIYHLLVRIPGGCFVVEEPYELIDIAKIEPTNSNGRVLSSWTSKGAGPYFTDGKSSYTFNTSKHTLLKRFSLVPTSRNAVGDLIPVRISEDPLNSLIEIYLSTAIKKIQPANKPLDKKYVVLPLYSTRTKGTKTVPDRSGINQWNAGGRQRTFGEAYIPVPAEVRHLEPDFFPPKDTEFELVLPNGKIVMSKVCQAQGKALMARPNTDLIDWLYEIIDGSMEVAKQRLATNHAYNYQDLLEIGKDSVRIVALSENKSRYLIEMGDLDSYEEFIENKVPQM